MNLLCIFIQLVVQIFHGSAEGKLAIIEPGSSTFISFENAYEYAGKKIPGVSYVQHNISSARVACSPNTEVNFDKENGDSCDWREPNGLPVNERKMIVDRQTCDLIIMFPRNGQTGTYSCIMSTKNGLSRHTFNRHVIVYYVPEYFLTYTARYLTFSCNEQILDKLMVELKVIFCPATHFDCKIKLTIAACSSREKEFWKTLNFNENTKSIVSYEAVKRIDPKAQLPMCELECIRKAYVKHLADLSYKEAVLQVRASADVFRDLTGLTFLPDISEEKINGICKEGYFIYQAKVCLPCPEGFYRTENMAMCEPCGYFYYQSQIGSASCRRCPQLGFSNSKDKKSVLECVPFYMSWQSVVLMSSIVLLLFMFIKTGCCSELYAYSRAKKDFSERDERLTKEVVFSRLSTSQPLDEIVETPTRLDGSAVSKMTRELSKMPKELQEMEPLTEEDAEFLKKDLKNVQTLSLSYDPRSTGLSKSYRKKKKQKFRSSDRDLPDIIQSRQHSALGWTHKYDVSSFQRQHPRPGLDISSDEDDEED